MKATRIRSVLPCLVITAFVAGCSDSGVADRISASRSDLIQEVVFSGGNLLDSPITTVSLRPGTTDQEANDFWCDVVVPAGGTDMDGDAGAVGVLSSDGARPLALDPTC